MGRLNHPPKHTHSIRQMICSTLSPSNGENAGSQLISTPNRYSTNSCGVRFLSSSASMLLLVCDGDVSKPDSRKPNPQHKVSLSKNSSSNQTNISIHQIPAYFLLYLEQLYGCSILPPTLHISTQHWESWISQTKIGCGQVGINTLCNWHHWQRKGVIV
jgi:hypothetical protein